tara:strand:- start:130 stop:465 length:336 start_codon:yes stop_codon:yes gene_type:complete
MNESNPNNINDLNDPNIFFDFDINLEQLKEIYHYDKKYQNNKFTNKFKARNYVAKIIDILNKAEKKGLSRKYILHKLIKLERKIDNDTKLQSVSKSSLLQKRKKKKEKKKK